MKGIVLLSGGLDSVVAAWLAREEIELVVALTCDYGQRAAQQEIRAASQIAARLAVPHQVIALPWVKSVAQDALTQGDKALPTPGAGELDSAAAEASAAAVWVPNRNGLLANIAAVYADALGCEAIIVGFNAEEGATFPDNTPAFVDSAAVFFSYSTRIGCRLVSPTLTLTKPEIVRVGREAGAPLDLVWSCYDAGPAPCGVCESCQRSQRAFAAASL